MARPMAIHGDHVYPVIGLAVGLFVSVSFFVFLCASHRRKIASKATPCLSLPKAVETKEGGGKREDAALWQKAILMGDKCRPPEFPGAIYYDYSGNQVPEMPRSPRSVHMGSMTSFSYVMAK